MTLHFWVPPVPYQAGWLQLKFLTVASNVRFTGQTTHLPISLRCCGPFEPVLTGDLRIDFKVREMEVMETCHGHGERPGIVESNCQRNYIALTLNPLDEVEGVRVYVNTIHPRYGVDRNRVDHQRVAIFIMPNGMSHPSCLDVLRVRPPIHPDLTDPVVPLVEDDYFLGSLNDLEYGCSVLPGSRRTEWSAVFPCQLVLPVRISTPDSFTTRRVYFLMSLVVKRLLPGPGLRGPCLDMEEIRKALFLHRQPNSIQVRNGTFCRRGGRRGRFLIGLAAYCHRKRKNHPRENDLHCTLHLIFLSA